MHEIRTIAIDDLSVCQSVCHAALLYKRGWTDWGPAWDEHSSGPKNILLDWGPDFPPARWGEWGELRLLYNAWTTDQIAILFVLETLEDSRHIVLDWDSDPLIAREVVFDAAFAKLLWPLVCLCFYLTSIFVVINISLSFVFVSTVILLLFRHKELCCIVTFIRDF